MKSELAILLLASFAVLLLPSAAVAQNVNYGADLYCQVKGIATSGIGTLAGLLLAFVGFVGFLITEKKGYLSMIVLGMAVTALPGLYESTISSMAGAFHGSRGAYVNHTTTLNCP